MDHQTYIEAVARIGIANLSEEERAGLPRFKLVYGAGSPLVRGTTYFGVWQNGSDQAEHFVEISAYGEDSPVQLAGTTLHEVGHVLAGFDAGHRQPWAEACSKLGLRRIKASTYYTPAHFAPKVREQIAALPLPMDGSPWFATQRAAGIKFPKGFMAVPPPPGFITRPCSSTHGCKGGKSRGKGSGSRMLKATCFCGYTIRLTKKWAETGMPTCHCGGVFALDTGP